MNFDPQTRLPGKETPKETKGLHNGSFGKKTAKGHFFFFSKQRSKNYVQGGNNELLEALMLTSNNT